jgi:RNA polymerase sigma-70 factor (ECF subfamily)
MVEIPFDQRNLRGARRAVRRMNPMEREIFLAMRFENATYEELAARLGIGVADVEVHFASSIVLLVQAMRDEERPWWKFWQR